MQKIDRYGNIEVGKLLTATENNESMLNSNRSLVLKQATYGPHTQFLGFLKCRERESLSSRGTEFNVTILSEPPTQPNGRPIEEPYH